MKTHKVFFTDDHAALRDALAELVNGFEHFESVGTASNGAEAVAAFEKGLLADIIILDLSMPVMDGYAVAKWLTVHRPELKILIMTMGVEKNKLELLLDLGISGIINKDVSRAELTIALEALADGNTYYSNSVTEDIVEYYRKQRTMKDKKQDLQLTETDKAFIRYCATDLTYKEIGDRMGLSKHATELLRVNLFAALNARTRTALAVYGIQMGIVNLDDVSA